MQRYRSLLIVIGIVVLLSLLGPTAWRWLDGAGSWIMVGVALISGLVWLIVRHQRSAR